MRPAYRLRQFLAALEPSKEAAVSEDLQAYLDSRQEELFQRMAHSERRHALAVLNHCRSHGRVPLELAQAALLHDIGKTQAPIALWQRVALVVLRPLSPGLLYRLAQRQGGLHVLLCHAQIGAKMAETVGLHPVACTLIREHHARPESAVLSAEERTLLAALQAADESN